MDSDDCAADVTLYATSLRSIKPLRPQYSSWLQSSAIVKYLNIRKVFQK